MEIKELKIFEQSYVADIDVLMHELSPEASATSDRVRKVIENPDMHLYVCLKDNRIVACATLCVCYTPEMVLGFIEAVVVSAFCRGQHLGKDIMEYIISEAKGFGVSSLHLTSNSKRIAANNLYKSLGFTLKETNCYTMQI